MSGPKFAPAFDFYPERWTHGTRHMTKIERCDYIELLCHQWTDDGLPISVEILARILGYTNARGEGVASKISEMVLAKFPVAADGKRRNERLESERSKQVTRLERKRTGAEITNAKRWGKRVDDESLSDQIATPERVDIESPPPTPHLRPLVSSIEETPLTPSGESVGMGYSQSFENFWTAYPKKTGKGAAWAAWKRAKAKPPTDELVATVNEQAQSDQWTKDGGRFIPNPATWINQRRWEDELPMEQEELSTAQKFSL